MWWAASAAPRAPPASPAAGWTQVPPDLAVGDAVEGDAAGEAEVALARLGREGAGQAQDDLFRDRLDRGGDVHVERREQGFGAAHGLAEQRLEALVHHGQPGRVVEIALVEAEAAVGLQVDEGVEDRLREARLAVGREAHQLVLARVHLESGVVGEGRVEEAEGVGEMQFPQHLDAVLAAERGRGGGGFADAVEGEDQRPPERGREERARRMAQVVLAEAQARSVELPDLAQFARQQVLLEELLAQPDRHRHAELAEAARRRRYVGLEEPLELDERLLVEHDRVDLGQRDAALAEAIAHGVRREAGVVLAAREALFLRGRDGRPVHHERGGAVVVVGRDPENAHAGSRRACR
jgi:hypothetical protein